MRKTRGQCLETFEEQKVLSFQLTVMSLNTPPHFIFPFISSFYSGFKDKFSKINPLLEAVFSHPFQKSI
jgi:hypothetical protein